MQQPMPNTCDSRVTLHADLAAQLRALFEHPDPAVAQCGVLAWFGSTTFPSGLANIPTLDQNDWKRVYTRLESAALSPDVLPTLVSLEEAAKSLRADEPIPIAIAHVQHLVPTADFQARVNEAAERGIALEPAPGTLASILEPARAFFICGLLHDQFGCVVPAARGRNVTFVLDDAFHCSNYDGKALPTDMELDPGDGSGFRPVAWSQHIATTYAQAGSATVSLRCRYGDIVLEGHCTLHISDVPAAPAPSDTWPLVGTPSGATGVAYVFRANGHLDVVHPLIVAEGFPGGYPSDYIYDALSGNDLLPNLRAEGYDLIVVSYDGTRPMEDNADVVVACITEALARVKERNVATPLVVGGVSMGGVVSRYALASMEARGIDHGTRLFFTVDSPHGGAYTNVSAQWLLHLLKPASSLARTLTGLLDSPANQQFITQWVTGGRAIVSPMRTKFLEALERLGQYPQKPRRVAIANGRGDGQRGIPAGAPLLIWKGSAFASAELSSLEEGREPRTVARGYCMRADPNTPSTMHAASPVSWEGAPGGLNVYNAMAAEVALGLGIGEVEDIAPLATAISTLSALDIDPARHDTFAPVPPPGSGASPFHDYICGIENTRHISITAESSAWLAAHIGTPT